MTLTLAEHLATSVIEEICPLCKLPLQEEDLLAPHFIDMAKVCTDCYLSQLEDQDGGGVSRDKKVDDEMDYD